MTAPNDVLHYILQKPRTYEEIRMRFGLSKLTLEKILMFLQEFGFIKLDEGQFKVTKVAMELMAIED